MITLHDIEEQTRSYANTHAILARRLQRLQQDVDDLKKRRLASILKALSITQEERLKLSAMIDDGRHLFGKPRSHIFHNIKVGLQKGKDELTIADVEKAIKIIEKKLPEQSELLIDVKKKLVRKAVAQLAHEDLKRIGGEFIPGQDQVLIKNTDSDIDKMINALVGKNDPEALEAQAQSA